MTLSCWAHLHLSESPNILSQELDAKRCIRKLPTPTPSRDTLCFCILISWNLGRGDSKDNGSSFHSLVDYWQVWRVMWTPTRELTIRDLQSAHSMPTDRAGDPSWAPLSLSQGCNTEFSREFLPSGLYSHAQWPWLSDSNCTFPMVAMGSKLSLWRLAYKT